MVDSSVRGGWTEGEGYYTVDEQGFVTHHESSIIPYAKAVVIHSGWTETDKIGLEQAVGETYWEDTYHYTRARMEGPLDLVVKDSGRQWGYDYTYAESGFADPIFVARTYYGSEM